MSSATVDRSPDNNRTTSAPHFPSNHEQRRARLEKLMALRRQPDELLRHTVELAQENEFLSIQLQKLQEMEELQEALRSEVQKLCMPEHFPCVITGMEQNGRLLVQASIPGMAPVRVEVHPDVDVARICIGARGYVNSTRNCLLELSDDPPAWKEVGSYEESIDGGCRILVRHHEHQIALNLAAVLRDVPLHQGDRIGFDDASAMAYVRLPNTRLAHLFTENVSQDHFADLGGLDEPIHQIKQAIGFRWRCPEIAERYRLPRKQGILLEGPPGNGKTRLARCAANYIQQLMPDQPCRFMQVTGSEDYSMWLGGTETKLKERFAAAREAARGGPVLIFFDEMDALGRQRGSDVGGAAPERILSTLLGWLDDVQKSLDNVLILAATNRADLIDPSLLRPGRLDRKITIPPPNRRAAEHILRRNLAGCVASPGTVDELIRPLVSAIYSPQGQHAKLVTVKLSDGREPSVSARELVSGAMLEGIVRRAAVGAAERDEQSGASGGISGDDLARALEEELLGIANVLRPHNVKGYVSSIPADAHPVDVRVQLVRRRSYLRSVS